MATLLQITNQVLRRLREEEVSNLTDSDYSLLVADFVSDMVMQVSLDHAWTALDHQIQFNTIADERDYDLGALVADGGAVLSGSGTTSRVTTEYSVPLYQSDGRPGAWIIANPSQTSWTRMQHVERTQISEWFWRDTGLRSDLPTHYGIRLNPNADAQFRGILLTMWPSPSVDDARVRIGFNTPLDQLDPTVDGDVNISLPNRVIVLGALYLALNERGEEIGEPGGIAERRFLDALAAAKESDINVRMRTGELDWYRG